MGAHIYATGIETHWCQVSAQSFFGQPYPSSKVLFCPDQQALYALTLEEILADSHMKMLSFAHLLIPACWALALSSTDQTPQAPRKEQLSRSLKNNNPLTALPSSSLPSLAFFFPFVLFKKCFQMAIFSVTSDFILHVLSISALLMKYFSGRRSSCLYILYINFSKQYITVERGWREIFFQKIICWKGHWWFSILLDVWT